MVLFYFHNLLFESEWANFALLLTVVAGLPVSWYFIVRGIRRYLRSKDRGSLLLTILVGALLLALPGFLTHDGFWFLIMFPFGLLGGWPGMFVFGAINSETAGIVGVYLACLMNVLGIYGVIDLIFPRRDLP
jgi:hypothetical protein